MWKIIFAADTFGRHIGHILQPPTSDQDNIVLLGAIIKCDMFKIQDSIRKPAVYVYLEVVTYTRHIGS